MAKLAFVLDTYGCSDSMIEAFDIAIKRIVNDIGDDNYIGYAKFTKTHDQISDLFKIDIKSRLEFEYQERKLCSQIEHGLQIGIDMLDKLPADYLDKKVVLITKNNDHFCPNYDIILSQMKDKKIKFIGIAIGPEVDFKLDELAEQTGGKLFKADEKNPDKLTNVIEESLAMVNTNERKLTIHDHQERQKVNSQTKTKANRDILIDLFGQTQKERSLITNRLLKSNVAMVTPLAMVAKTNQQSSNLDFLKKTKAHDDLIKASPSLKHIQEQESKRPTSIWHDTHHKLVIQPESELHFGGPFNRPVTSHLHLSNPSTVSAFVQVLAPNQYTIERKSTMIKGGCSDRIAITHQPFNHDRLKDMCSDTITVFVGEANEDNQLADAPKQWIKESIIKCVFDMPTDIGAKIETSSTNVDHPKAECGNPSKTTKETSNDQGITQVINQGNFHNPHTVEDDKVEESGKQKEEVKKILNKIKRNVYFINNCSELDGLGDEEREVLLNRVKDIKTSADSEQNDLNFLKSKAEELIKIKNELVVDNSI